MKVYLAGKIGKNDWRHNLVPLMRDTYYSPDYMNTEEWTEVPMKCGFTYVGPYFVSCDHGCAHRAKHAWDGGCSGAQDHGYDRYLVAGLCREAIAKCDVLFAWMNEGLTAYGTLVEIGMAHALGKRVILAQSDEYWSDDLWFAYQHATDVFFAPNAIQAFEKWLRTQNWQLESAQISRCESPLEKDFFAAYLNSYNTYPHLHGLVVQHPVTVNGESYRLDFALPNRKIAFEMDGYTYHGKDRTDFNRDRRRDLNLKLAGWEVHRFDGDLIRQDPFHIVELAAKLAEPR